MVKDIRKISLYILLICLTFNQVSFSQNLLSNVSVYTEEDGLTHNTVNTICRSASGYLWIGTGDGLCRFNGNTFNNFDKRSNSQFYLTNNVISAIVEDENENLWVATMNGLNKYIVEKDSFEHFFLTGSHNTGNDSYEFSDINSLAVDDDILWIGTSSGLLRFNLITYNYTIIDLHSNDKLLKPVTEIISISNNGKYLWLGTNNGLYVYDKDEKKCIGVGLEKENNINGSRVNHVRIDKKGAVWISTENGISKIVQKESNFLIENFEAYHSSKEEQKAKDFYFSVQVNDTAVIAGNMDSGLYYLNLKTGNFERHYFHYHQTETLRFTDHFHDKLNNILWVGGINTGLFRFNLSSKIFSPVRMYSTSGSLIRFYSFCADCDNTDIVWSGTTNGLVRYNRKNGQTSSYFLDFSSKINYTIVALEDSKRGNLYIGTYEKGLYTFDKNTAIFKKHLFSEKFPEYKEIKALLRHKDKLYIGSANMLFVYDKKTFEFEQYEVNTYAKDRIFSLLPVNEEDILIGSVSGHISRFNIAKKKVLKVPNEFSDTTQRFGVIMDLYEHDDRVLLSSFEKGVFVYDKKEKIVYKDKAFSFADDRDLYGIRAGNDGKLWMPTNHGLLRFSPIDSSWVEFEQFDGLQDNEFNGGAVFQTPDGELFFGGNDGFNNFFSKSIKITKKTLQIHLEEFSIFGRSIVPGDTINNSKEISKLITFSDTVELSYKHNYIGIRFAAIDLMHPKKVMYRYKLDNLNSNWIYKNSDNNFATFTNIEPGNYTFIVQAAGKFSDFRDNERRLYIVIEPPFWQKLLFYIIVAIILLLAFVIFIKLRERALKTEKRKLEQLVDVRTIEIKQAGERLEQEKKFTDAVILNTSEGIAIFDKHGTFMRVNPALAKMLGYNIPDLINRAFYDFIPTEWSEQFKADLNKLFEGISVVSETELIRKDKSLIDVRISSALILDSAVVSVITDISERKITEYKAEQYRTELEKIVKERTIDYKKAKEEAENADHLKTAFLANMSHEIRTPLNSILGFAQLLNEEDITIEQTKTYTGLIQRGGNSLLHLINDIIDLAKIESNQLSIEAEDFSVNEVVEDVYKMFLNSKENIENPKLNIRINIPAQDVVLHSDPNRLKQVIINLMNNSQKFTERGYIELGYSHSIEKGKVFLRFYVEDSGSGIPKTKIDRIFSRFTKFDKNSTHVLKGAGLGLAISKRIVELLGGRIYVLSEAGEGSVFYFTVPV